MNADKEAMKNCDLFIEGYFTQRVRAGDRPDYGYPMNYLPEITVARMQIHTIFMAGEPE